MNQQDAEQPVAGKRRLPDQNGQPRFPQYGLCGDYTSARRNRRAFRSIVAAWLSLTFLFWFAEHFLQYDLAETKYIMSLTHEDNSARAILRDVVKRDQETAGERTPHYVSALAEIEERDIVIERYAEAYALDPGNADLAINYGCRLYFDEQYKAARERFREAAIQAQGNPLPRYLEAAALLAASSLEEDEISEVMAIIARTNSATAPVVFPAPLWHESLPEKGHWLVRRRNRIVERCCVPLYQLQSVLFALARKEIAQGRGMQWESWLLHLQEMGERIVGGPAAHPHERKGLMIRDSVAQCILGIEFQRDALAERLHLLQQDKGETGEALVEQRLRLGENLERLQAFEEQRQDALTSERKRFAFPVVLCVQTLFCVAVAYLCAAFLNKIISSNRRVWSLPHSRAAMFSIVTGTVLLFALLLAIMALQRSPLPFEGWSQALRLAWWVVIVTWLLMGALLPWLLLPRASKVVQEMAEDMPKDVLKSARRCRWIAGFSLMRRYFGICLGLTMSVIVLWGLLHRLIWAVYPADYAFLVSGLLEDEHALVAAVRRLLQEGSGL